MKRFLLLLLLATATIASYAQTPAFWSPLPLEDQSREGRYITPEMARGYQLDTTAMRAHLQQAVSAPVWQLDAAIDVVELPLPNGKAMAFRYQETPLMHPELAARYPAIRTYTGVAVAQNTVRVKFDLTPAGFHAMISGLPQGDAFIDPVTTASSVLHQAYWKKDLVRSQAQLPAACGYDQVNDLDALMEHPATPAPPGRAARVGDCQFRTYRLALACTGEYANFHGATGGNMAPAMAAMATTLNRVNGIFERDATLTMVLVANNDQLVFTDPTTDGYSNNDGFAMLEENRVKCNAVIGSANYDIGHVFSTGGGGVAYLNGPCGYYKAGGVTGGPTPVGDPFDIDYVAHEMGHQYGANHTQNNNCNRATPASVEPGSGITIMGYAGICSPDVGNNSIAMFGGYSLQEIHANITTGTSSTCPQTVPLINAPPSVSAGANHTIPKGTPFVLTASASDPDGGDQLTYSWEQMDYQPSTQPPSANSTNGPNFRPWLPTPEPERWFPRLEVVASGNAPSPNWEVLSNVGRTFNFRVTVRDNAVGGGCNAQDNMSVSVNGTAGPFVVTQPNTAMTWAEGSSQTVNWSVAGTQNAPVSCALVDILLSTDGGLTWPHLLATGVPNNGTANVNAPMLSTATARVMVRANGNVFYDMSDEDFTIGQGAYCIPTSLYGTGDGDFIDGVVMGSITNTGTGSTTGPSYTDFTIHTTELVRGETYTLSITGGNYTSDNYAAWIDYNADRTFGGAEKLGEFTTTAPGQTQDITFQVPANAELGSTVMRVRGVYHLTGEPSPTDPCYPYAYGETEDYGILIVDHEQVRVSAKVFLEGPYRSETGLMGDQLREAGAIPLQEPYTALGFEEPGSGGESTDQGVFAGQGPTAVVDWLRLELRAHNAPHTIVAARNALVLRNGNVVDVDGTSPVTFQQEPGNYYLAVRHRNHLGVMTGTALAMGATPLTVDFSSTATDLYGTEPTHTIAGMRALWMGNAVSDGALKYTGAGNDRDAIIQLLGGEPNEVRTGYYAEDTNMDGQVKYIGATNDRDPILQGIGGAVSTATRAEQLP